MLNRKIIVLSLGLSLIACGGTDTGVGAPNASSSSTSSSESSNSSSSPSNSSSSSSSIGSGAQNAVFTLQENQVGVCRVDGDPSETKNAGYTGTGYANVDNAQNTSVVWAIEAPSSGSYSLTLRFANGGEIDRNGMLTINGGSNGSYMLALEATNAWTSWAEDSLSVELVQGNNILQLTSQTAEGLANIDSLSITGAQTSAGDCGGVTTLPSGEYSLLPQNGNPIHSRISRALTEWSASQTNNILSYQYANGGWPKNQEYDTVGPGGNGSGTIDNGATTSEMTFLAGLYKNDPQARYRDSVRKAVDYLLEMQYPSGGWPQFYPLTGGYHDHATFNDNAMTRVLIVMHYMVERMAPYDTDIITDNQRARAATAIAKGVDYIVKSQWKQNGTLTAWCAQHGATDYLPKAARAYELESISGSESVEIIGFLMTQPQSPAIETAIKAAVNWFRSPNTVLENYTYSKSVEEKIVYQAGSKMWYRFYDLYTNQGFFSDRDGGTYYDLMEISAERRNGYSWGGNYGASIISYAESVGY